MGRTIIWNLDRWLVLLKLPFNNPIFLDRAATIRSSNLSSPGLRSVESNIDYGRKLRFHGLILFHHYLLASDYQAGRWPGFTKCLWFFASLFKVKSFFYNLIILELSDVFKMTEVHQNQMLIMIYYIWQEYINILNIIHYIMFDKFIYQLSLII